MAKVPDLRNFSPMESQAKNVDDTKMLDTEAHESVNMNESNKVGEEFVNSSPKMPTLGSKGRN